MNDKIAFGSYIYGDSCIHQLSTQVKIILTCVFSICIFFVSTWAGIGLFASLVVVCYRMSGINLRNALAGLAPVAFVLVFTVVAHMATGSRHDLPSVAPNLSVLVNADPVLCGFLSGLFVSSRIVLLVAACSLLTFTASPLQVMNGLQASLFPLRLAKVPVDELCLVISIALRFIPTITEEAYGLKRSYESRCARFDNPVDAISSWAKVLVLLLVRLFQRSEKLAVALQARCYDGGSRTSLHCDTLTATDKLAALAVSVVIICVAVLL